LPSRCYIFNDDSESTSYDSLDYKTYQKIVPCSTTTIISSVAIVKIQEVKIGNADMRYKIPQFANRPDCPAVITALFSADCTTAVSTAFSNAVDLTSSLVSGFYYGSLNDVTTVSIYEFCLKVSAAGLSKTVPGLKLDVYECTAAKITSA